MTVADIENEARKILVDNGTAKRWSRDEIRLSLQSGIFALHSIRPETRYVNGLLLDFVSLPSSDETAIDISERFREALVYYVVYRCYLDDAADTVNTQLAESYLQKFNARAQL